MKVSLKSITPDIETTIVEIARVSSSRENKSEKPEGLINYLIKNKHWSPFEHGMITMEIETSKAIAIQLLRHRSFTFQEFSQRYQNVCEISGDGMFEDVELRKQATDNRQSSEDVFEGLLSNAVCGEATYHLTPVDSVEAIENHLKTSEILYNQMIEKGVARETARMILPMATKTKLYMTGTVRSWIHLLDIRDDSHAQKEIQEVAKAMKDVVIIECPIIAKARGWVEVIDLNTCNPGDILLSFEGEELEYVGLLDEKSVYRHEVRYKSGVFGTRTDEGLAWKELRGGVDIKSIIYKGSKKEGKKHFIDTETGEKYELKKIN